MELMEAEALKRYSLKVDAATGELVDQDNDDPGVEIDRLTRKFMAEPGLDPRDPASYVKAYKAVKANPDNRAVVRAYGVS